MTSGSAQEEQKYLLGLKRGWGAVKKGSVVARLKDRQECEVDVASGLSREGMSPAFHLSCSRNKIREDL